MSCSMSAAARAASVPRILMLFALLRTTASAPKYASVDLRRGLDRLVEAPYASAFPRPPAAWNVSSSRFVLADGKKGPPPKLDELPEGLAEQFTMHGKAQLESYMVDDTGPQADGTHYSYTRQQIEQMVKRAKKFRADLAGESKGESARAADAARRALRKDAVVFDALVDCDCLEGASVAVVGSVEPWWEAVAIAFGARKVVTVEHNKISLTHPNLEAEAKTPEAWAADDTAIDVVLSITSIDHDGLGRYGDAIAPDADLWAMWLARSKRPRRLVLTLPIGPDVVAWNLMRRYGRARLPLLLRGWKVVNKFGWDSAKAVAAGPYYRPYEPALLLEPAAEAGTLGDNDELKSELFGAAAEEEEEPVIIDGGARDEL